MQSQVEPQVSVFEACYSLARTQVENLTEEVYKKRQPGAGISLADEFNDNKSTVYRQNMLHREFIDSSPDRLRMVSDMTT